MSAPSYTKHEHLALKDHAHFSERWVQDRIKEDPSVLGLGADVVVLDRERSQKGAGRLDLLLTDPEQDVRYEVELMLGPTDASHIVRTLEYWDIERRRYPGYDHCAVLVAEDITSRFLNVLALLAGTVPLVAIQMSALQTGDVVLLHFTRVLDQRVLRRDDEAESKDVDVDRAYWEGRASEEVLKLTDSVLDIINDAADPKQQLNYNKRHIGLSDGLRRRNFVYFVPRRRYVRVIIPRGASLEEWAAECDEEGLKADHNRRGLCITVAAQDLDVHRDLLGRIIHAVVAEESG